MLAGQICDWRKKMLEFLPWSEQTLQQSLKNYKEKHQMSILDIELGGACNMCCVYCDTPNRNMCVQYNTNDIEELIKKENIKWLFICGLGEPTMIDNIGLLKQLLALCQKLDVKCCLFSNIVNFDEDLFTYIDLGVLYPMFKLDSFDSGLLTSLYGVNQKTIEKHLSNVYEMCNHVKVDNNITNICASIVPTNINQDQIPKLVQWCVEHSIFPLIGELEAAGQGLSIYDKLKVSESDLSQLKKKIINVLGADYKIPICPSVLFGIHINHQGQIIVDKLSGLSCHWFWLKEPKVEIIASIREVSLFDVTRRIIDNRKGKVSDVRQFLLSSPSLIFGGCGGNITDLLSFYLENLV